MARGRGFTRGYARGGSHARNGQTSGHGRAPLTHFLCLPLVTNSSKAELEASLERFKSMVKDINDKPSVSDSSASGQLKIPLRAIRPVDTLHLTLGVMSLQEEHRLQEAIDLLKGLDIVELLESSRPIGSQPLDVNQQPLRISLRSLISMHTPTDTSVLYADPVDTSNRLYSFGEKLQDKFRQRGFMTEDRRPLKLHTTVLNTVYAKIGRDKLRINATRLLEECKEFSWIQDLRIESVAICKMGAKKEFKPNGDLLSEKYEEVCAIALPG